MLAVQKDKQALSDLRDAFRRAGGLPLDSLGTRAKLVRAGFGWAVGRARIRFCSNSFHRAIRILIGKYRLPIVYYHANMPHACCSPCLHDLPLGLGLSFPLFCSLQRLNLLPFICFRTLSQKRPGGGGSPTLPKRTNDEPTNHDPAKPMQNQHIRKGQAEGGRASAQLASCEPHH
jgi:hypothetical protein